MDLSYFVDLKNGAVIGEVQNLIGLYIIQQKLLPRQFTNIRRCGAAGTKEVIDAMDPTKKTKDSVKTSSFRTRAAMYLSNFITDGIIHCCLTVPRSINLGHSVKVRAEPQDARDARPGYAVKSSTRIQVREREYHDNLLKLGMKSVRWGRNEWFQGDLGKMKTALRMIGRGTFYDFSKGNVAPKSEKLVGGVELDEFEFDHRRSPRLEAEAISKEDFETLKAGGKRGQEIARRLAVAGRTRGGKKALEEFTSNKATIDALTNEADKKRARAVARALAALA